MAKFRKKPVVVEATQWFPNGTYRFLPLVAPSDKRCQHCGQEMCVHGLIDTKEGGHIVCPGDWIITGVQGEMYPCKPDIFAANYEEAE